MASRSVIVSLGHLGLMQGLHDRILQIVGMPSKPPTKDLGMCNLKVHQPRSWLMTAADLILNDCPCPKRFARHYAAELAAEVCTDIVLVLQIDSCIDHDTHLRTKSRRLGQIYEISN